MLPVCLLLGPCAPTALFSAASATDSRPGLLLTYSSAVGTNATDTVSAPNVWLYVPSIHSPTPFLPAASFQAVWTGTLSVDLRGDYAFEADLAGSLKLELNGEIALEDTGQGGRTHKSKTVRLKKGPNLFQATYTAPTAGEAFIRLLWSEVNGTPQPIPDQLLQHTNHPSLRRAEKLRFGRELFLEHRCFKCHSAPEADLPEMAMDAPSFVGIGARRRRAWMARWILDPKAERPSARMPKLLLGPNARQDAEAIAAYLETLGSPEAPAASEPPGEIEPGRNLAEVLNCAGCHWLPAAVAADAEKISLGHVREKFPPGQLQQFLQRPGADYLWTRMPDFRLTGQEARDLAAYLLSAAAQPKDHAHTADPLLAERGQKLVQTSGCLNCHSLATKNLFATASLVKLTPDHWQDGCLAPSPKDHSRAPHFAFAPAEREALQAFGASDRASLRRPVAAEFAERQVRLLNCAACHGQIEGFPSLEVIGGKLKPEWSGAFLAGEIPYKPRTWLAQRMPAFPSRARLLAQGLAMRHGYPPFTPAEPPLNAAAAQMGAKLIGSEGGFNCIACHGIGSFRAAAVFESEGINLAYSAVRLLRPYFERWMLNPLKLDPQTKMPMFFEGGRSQLTEILEGDAAKQLDALWQCLRQGERMPFPGGGAQPAKAD